MLLAEWNMDDALAVRYEEGREEGMEEGHKEGMEEGRKAVARNALANGFSIEAIQAITGLDVGAIRQLTEK